jgi:pyridoxamine 5'-phosphate oxidase
MPDARTQDPLDLFQQWLADAQACKAIEEPTAMTLATIDELGLPDARIVLLKGCDARGVTFYTNLTSPKARQLEARPQAALCFHWMPLERQVRMAGPVVKVSDEEADAYFATRPRQSQIGAWASKQSQPLTGRFELERRVARFTAQFGLGPVVRPPFWSGFCLQPLRIEFWQKRPFRLHERRQYQRADLLSGWSCCRMYP